MARFLDSLSQPVRPAATDIIRLPLLCVLVFATTLSAGAQQPTAAAPSPTVTPATPAAPKDGSAPIKSDVRYRIGAGDVLDVRLVKSPELSREAVRVDAQGMIRMPMLDDDIKAACLTEGELSVVIAARYLKYKRKPHVDVFVKEYNSQPVALIGAVKMPGRFQLQRPVRLLELLSYAGGPSDNSGARIQVVHSLLQSICENPAAVTSDDDVTEGVTYYSLIETLRGRDNANPFVRPGDVISLPEADQAFIVGNVLRPMAIALKEPITISRAIAMAGGLMPDTKTDKVRLVRQPSGGLAKSEILINLKAVSKHEVEDITLQAGDIVEVPTSGSKRFLRALVGTIAPSLSQLPIRVIP